MRQHFCAHRLKKIHHGYGMKTMSLCLTRLKTILQLHPSYLIMNRRASLPLTLSVDASQFAVGVVILQNDKPCAYASQTLTSAQQNCAQIEKELYAIVFGCKRFHQQLYGQVVKVQTDLYFHCSKSLYNQFLLDYSV